MRIRAILLLISIALFGGCTKPKPIIVTKKAMPEASLRASVTGVFPGAVPFEDYIDSLLFFLYAVHRIEPQKILLGQSTCVDDVLNTKSPFTDHEVKGPFNFGGLGGLPFTGLSGLDAYAHHIPDSGAALLVVGPHIGFSEKGGWGTLSREGQLHTSPCCGALVQALARLQTPGAIRKMRPSEPDYQEQVIEQLALLHKSEILESKVPLITLTKVVFREIENQMANLPQEKVDYRYVITIAAVIINTDQGSPDYIWVDHMSILDLETDQFLRIMEK